MQLPTSCVPTCQVICHIIHTVAVVHRELARVNIFCIRDWRERQRKKKSVCCGTGCGREAAPELSKANTHCCK